MPFAFRRMVLRRHGPDQRDGGLQGLDGGRTVLTSPRNPSLYHVAPIAAQEVFDLARHIRRQQPRDALVRRPLRAHLGRAGEADFLLAGAHGVGQLAILLFLDLLALGEEGIQLRVRGVEHAHVAAVGDLDLIDQLQQLDEEGVVDVDHLAPADRDGRNAVQEAPRRMAAVGEEALVLHGRLQHRGLQAGHQPLHAVRDVRVVEDLVEQFCDDVQRDRVLRAHVARGGAVAHHAHEVGVGAGVRRRRRCLQRLHRVEELQAAAAGPGGGGCAVLAARLYQPVEGA